MAVLTRYRQARSRRAPLAAIEQVHHAIAEDITVSARHTLVTDEQWGRLQAASEYRELILRRIGVYRDGAPSGFWMSGVVRGPAAGRGPEVVTGPAVCTAGPSDRPEEAMEVSVQTSAVIDPCQADAMPTMTTTTTDSGLLTREQLNGTASELYTLSDWAHLQAARIKHRLLADDPDGDTLAEIVADLKFCAARAEAACQAYYAERDQ